MSKPELPQTVTDPEGRVVVFTERSWKHILTWRPELVDDLRPILQRFRVRMTVSATGSSAESASIGNT